MPKMKGYGMNSKGKRRVPNENTFIVQPSSMTNGMGNSKVVRGTDLRTKNKK